MKLWVRSKSKIDLMCIRRVQYGNINSSHIIYGENTTMYLGEYPTKERCLEIIDEIQMLLESNGSIDDRISQAVSGIKNEFIVYEMPQE